MLKRILSVWLSVMLVSCTLGGLTLTASAATVSENIRWSEDFTNATSSTKNGERSVAFNQSYTWLKDGSGNFVFVKQGGGYSGDQNNNTYVAYIEEFNNNKMLHYNPTANASGASLILERTFGTGGAGIGATDANNDNNKFVYDTLSSGTTYATSGAWNFSFDFYPVNSNEKLIFSSVVGSGNEKSLFVYDNGTAQLLNGQKSVSLANGEWHRFNFAADGNGKIEAYINGVKVAENNDANLWSKLCWIYFKFQKIDGTIGEYYLDNFKVSDQAQGFFGTGSAFDCTVTNSLGFEIKDTAADGGATSTVVIPEAVANEKTAQNFCDSLTLASVVPNAAPVLYDADGKEIEDYENTKMKDVSKMVVSTGYAEREYKIFVEVETFASSSYTVSHADKKISGVKKNTKVKDFTDALSAVNDATLKVKNNGTLLGEDDLITDGATLVSTYNGADFVYNIEFAKYWTEDFTTTSGAYNWNGNSLKDSTGSLMFEATKWVYRATDNSETGFYYRTDDNTITSDYERNWIPSGNYNNGVYNGQFRTYLKDFDKNYDIKVKSNLVHKLKSDGKSAGTPVTTNGAYNFEFAFKPEKTLFDLDIRGVKPDNSEFSFISFEKSAYKAFGSDISLTGINADANGFYNFKIEYFGNGVADVTVNGTKVVSNLNGGGDISAVKFATMAYFKNATTDYTDYRLDNIDLYPVAYEAPTTATEIALYKDSVAIANKVTEKSQLIGGASYIARADVSCYEASLPTMLVIAVYKDNALSKVNAGTKTFTYSQTDAYDEVTLTASDVEGADRVCVFLWNGVSLKPFKSIEIK